ncbi:guanine nucleotide binding protein, alpha subunit [Backusella circina FSU 941]|nr:guanine nucleotide binding protein, alpha subunit [Backusella circina FSU 941]
MGNIKSSLRSQDDHAGSSAVSRKIDKQIKADHKRMKKEVKLLLLGAGESGKSTVLKQMRLIHASGFKPSEREGFRVIVFLNVFQTMQTLIEAAQSFNLIDSSLEVEHTKLFTEAPSLDEHQRFPENFYIPLKTLWEHESIKETMKHAQTLALHDNIS